MDPSTDPDSHLSQTEPRTDTYLSIACRELVAHVTAITAFAELLLKAGLPNRQGQEWLEILHRHAQRLGAVASDLLDLAGVLAGKLAINLERLAVTEALDMALAAIRPTTDKHRFVVSTGPEIPVVLADRQRLAQVLANLLDNAVKYSPEGGVITVAAYHRPERGQVVVSVADQGLGIAPEDQEKIFIPFQRINRAETQDIKGRGLGLYVVRELLERMGGEIWLESELDKGSCFFFSLPTLSGDLSGPPL